MSEYLTTKELAELLRIKERKVYDLAASGEVPCSKAMGKLLFPRKAVETWLAERSSGLVGMEQPRLPNVVLGSHDPLLDWALRESRCGLATYFDGSFDGLDRFCRREGLAAGLHLFDAPANAWNVPAVAQRCGASPVVLAQWAKRQRGLIVGGKHKTKIRKLNDLAGLRVAARQTESGAQHLFVQQLAAAGLSPDALDLTIQVRTEVEAAVAVLEGKADAAFGLEALAAQYRLTFVPVIEERFDLLVDRRSWFEPPLQTFFAFCHDAVFRTRVTDLAGYDVSGLGTIHFNGA